MPDHQAPPGSNGNRRPEDIQQDIDATRARLDETLSEIERRLGGRRAGARAGVAAKEFTGELFGLLDGNGGRTLSALGDAVRRNPLPALLIGIGAAWLAYEVIAHRRDRDHPAADADHLPDDLADMLEDLLGLSREATRALRQAGEATPPGPLHDALRQAAELHGHTARLVQQALLGTGRDTAADGRRTRRTAEWQQVESLIPHADRDALLAAIARAEDMTVKRFQAALHRPLPEDLRVLLGNRFHDLAESSDRLSALIEATV